MFRKTLQKGIGTNTFAVVINKQLFSLNEDIWHLYEEQHKSQIIPVIFNFAGWKINSIITRLVSQNYKPF